MNMNLRTALEHFKHCAADAPKGCYEEAKRINNVIDNFCSSLMRDVRALGLKADACDLIFDVEAAIYDYVRRSNPDATVFPTAEGFGASLTGPSRERVLIQSERDRDHLLHLQTSEAVSKGGATILNATGTFKAGHATFSNGEQVDIEVLPREFTNRLSSDDLHKACAFDKGI